MHSAFLTRLMSNREMGKILRHNSHLVTSYLTTMFWPNRGLHAYVKCVCSRMDTVYLCCNQYTVFSPISTCTRNNGHKDTGYIWPHVTVGAHTYMTGATNQREYSQVMFFSDNVATHAYGHPNEDHNNHIQLDLSIKATPRK